MPCRSCMVAKLPTTHMNSTDTVKRMKSLFQSPALPHPPPRPPDLPLPPQHYPALSEALSATKARSKPPPVALSAPALPKKSTNQATSLTAQRPAPPPKQAASSTSTISDQPMEPASEAHRCTHGPNRLHRPVL